MEASMRSLIAISLTALALFLTACGTVSDPPSPADIHITCADVQNAGATSACNNAIPAGLGAAALLGTVSEGGIVNTATVIMVNATIVNSGGSPSDLETLFAIDITCGPAFIGFPYSVMTTSSGGTLAAGATVPMFDGANCPEGPPGPAQAMIYVYSGVNNLSQDWTPAAYAAHEWDHWIVNVTMQ
jgi:hypothetical protein